MRNSGPRVASFLQPVFLALALLTAMPAWSQEPASAQTVPRRLLVNVAADATAAFTSDDLFMISRSVLLRLQLATTEIVAVESIGETSSAAGEDSTLVLTVSGTWSAVKIHAVSVDLISRATILDATIERDGWTSSDGLADEGWKEIVEPLARGYHKIAAAASTQNGPLLVRLTVRALPGTVLFGPEGSQKLVGASGFATWDAPVSRQYSLRSRLPGYQPVKMDFFLSGDREISLQQPKDPWWSVEASLMDLSTPRLDVSRALDPVLFLRLGLSTSLVALDVSSGGLFTSEPLSVVSLQLGVYVTPEDSVVRLYWGIGAFVRVVTASGQTPYLDTLSPWGQTMVFGGEVSPFGGGAFFVEWTPTFYMTTVPDLLKAALGSGNVPPGWVFYADSAAELLAFRLGYGWKL